jgi:hypothetical protein
VIQRVTNRFTDRTLRQNLGRLGFQPRMKLLEDRPTASQ